MKWLVIMAALLVATIRYVAPSPRTSTNTPPCPAHTRREFLEGRLRLLAWTETEIDAMVKRLDDDTLPERDRAVAWNTLQQRRYLWQTWDTKYTPWSMCTGPCSNW